MTVKFITGEPAALLPGRILVIADLHIGAEYEIRQAGIKLPSQTGKLLEKTESLVRQTKAKKLIILGDIKHKVPGLSFQEGREVPAFLNALNKIADVEIVPGNHDGDLRKLVPNLTFHPPAGFLLGGCYLLHGHAWPSPDFAKASHILIGHNHPMIEFRDRLGYVWREHVWVRSGLDRKVIGDKYGSAGKLKNLPEVIIMPAYNSMVGGRPLNNPRERTNLMGPIAKSVNMKKARLYLLDGTYLGELGALKSTVL